MQPTKLLIPSRALGTLPYSQSNDAHDVRSMRLSCFAGCELHVQAILGLPVQSPLTSDWLSESREDTTRLHGVATCGLRVGAVPATIGSGRGSHVLNLDCRRAKLNLLNRPDTGAYLVGDSRAAGTFVTFRRARSGPMHIGW